MAEPTELSILEELFKDRFTEKDVKYMATVRKPLDPPPTVENWYSRPKRIYDWASQQGRGRGHHEGQRGHYRGRGYHGNRDGHYQQDHRRDYRDQGQRHHDGYNQRHRSQHGGYSQQHQGDRHHNRGQHESHSEGGHQGHSERPPGPSRVYYPGMKPGQFEEAKQARHHPYKRDSHQGQRPPTGDSHQGQRPPT